ncbi:hypothetical protein [Streptomyces sp. NPDC050546]|uniref:hypothetical protein n=1 Tax=Streptomyces sp. NPDC050546 TaxID=3365628 RepID=UPI0037BA33CC
MGISDEQFCPAPENWVGRFKEPHQRSRTTARLETSDHDRFPARIRFKSKGDDGAWCLERVRVAACG